MPNLSGAQTRGRSLCHSSLAWSLVNSRDGFSKHLCWAFASQIDVCHENVMLGRLGDHGCSTCGLAIDSY
jgi:hypothetical protein